MDNIILYLDCFGGGDELLSIKRDWFTGEMLSVPYIIEDKMQWAVHIHLQLNTDAYNAFELTHNAMRPNCYLITEDELALLMLQYEIHYY